MELNYCIDCDREIWLSVIRCRLCERVLCYKVRGRKLV